MATQPELDPETWDLKLTTTGDLALVRDGYETAQHLRQRLNFFEGEWAWNLSAGIPWYQEVLGKRRFATQLDNRAYAESILRTEILETPGVTRLISFNFTFDEVHRQAVFNFRVDTQWGQVGDEYFEMSVN